MAKAVMEAFPQLPNMDFGTSKKDMVRERKALALQILQASGSRFFHVVRFPYLNT